MNHAVTSTVAYLADPAASPAEAQALAAQRGWGRATLLRRRGAALAGVPERQRPALPDAIQIRSAWRAARPRLLPVFAAAEVEQQAEHIRAALALYEAVLDGDSAAERFEQALYAARLAPRFEMLAASEDEGDPQEIETIEFDAVEDDEPVAENLWVKLSWLSFEDDDASLRFRFSFGLAGYEDVAADVPRQQAAAELTAALFPESAVISAAPRLAALLGAAAGDEGDDDALEALINRCPAFTRQLIEHGHCYLLQPGDFILLPQHEAARCAWHSVFCLDEFAGEALSFAVRAV